MKNKRKSSQNDLLKYKIATELGLSSKINENGWGALTAAETGKIGGIISARNKKNNSNHDIGSDKNRLT